MKNNRLAEYIQLAIAAARAFYGDFTGIVVETVKQAPKIIAVAIAILVIVVILPILFIQSLFKGLEVSSDSSLDNLAIRCLEYKEDWIKVLTLFQVKKLATHSNDRNSENSIADAANALRTNTADDFLTKGKTSSFKKLYVNNLELMENLLSSLAGYSTFCETIALPPLCESVEKILNPSTQKHEIYANIKVKIGTIKKDPLKHINEDVDLFEVHKQLIYGTNAVDQFAVDDTTIRVEYKKFILKSYFPIPLGTTCTFANDFGNARVHDGKQESHQGCDIFAPLGTPIICIEDCTIQKIGWDSLGGWRILMKSKDGNKTYYYAHMENYSQDLAQYMDYSGKVAENPGIILKAGQNIGYVGSSGSASTKSKPGSDTGTSPHLHFEIWVNNKSWFNDKDTLINPYWVLKLLHSKPIYN